MPFTYILFSAELDKYYIGSTSTSLENRLRRHLSNHSGFTGKTKDWRIVYAEQYLKMEFAVLREIEIKSWKSREMIVRMIKKELL